MKLWRGSLSAVLYLLLTVALVISSAVPARAAADLGFRGPLFTGTSAPTAEKPQSKLWFQDGIWWGVLFTPNSDGFTIHRLDWATQTWADTGVLVDSRNQVKVDALWDGGKLYIVSAGMNAINAGDSISVHRFSYDSAAKTYAADPGYPVTPVSGGAEAVVINKDSIGTLWLTYTRNQKVYVVRTNSAGAWQSPYVIPVAGASTLTPDDISSIVTFGGNKVGVFWGNQAENAYYFAVHFDGAPDSDWTREVAYVGPQFADDHMNVKSMQSDPEGRVFAVVKTSLNKPQDPLHVLLVRNSTGTWDTDNVVSRKADDATRTTLEIDGENQRVYTFAAARCCSGGVIYMKSVSMQSLANGNPFGPGLGAPFISGSLDRTINNPTSTKQTLDNTTNLVVLAGDDTTKRYLHNVIDLGRPDTTPPDTTIMSGPSGTVSESSATFAFSANQPGSTFECDLDGQGYAPCTSPSQRSDLTNGSHTFSVRARNAVGDVDPSPATATWTADAGLDTFLTAKSSDPSGSVNATFDITASDAAATFECRLDGGEFSVCSSPHQLSGLTAGRHRLEVRGVVAGRADSTPAAHEWAVDPTIPLVLNPSADAAVRSDSPAENFGTDGSLGVDTSPVEESYLRFDVRGPEGHTLDSAKLRLHLTNGSMNGPGVYLADNGWDESAVTWNTKPATTSGEEANLDSVATNAWIEYDVKAAITGDGTYTFAVLPESSDGMVASSREAPSNQPELHLTFRATDTTAPETTITSGPDGTVPVRSASFQFAANEPGSAFECALDVAPFSACSSPIDYRELSDGIHRFSVRATDPAGNLDTSPATRTWSVRAPVETHLESSPAALTSEKASTFTFGSNKTTATFECRLDTAVFSSCASPLHLTGLGEGAHNFEVRAIEAGVPDATPTVYDWTIDPNVTLTNAFAATADTTAPETTITEAPDGTVSETSAFFMFTSNQPGSTFECALDKAPFSSCSSPVDYSGLADGTHTFAVRATDPAGNLDASPAARTWTVREPVRTFLVATPLATTSDTATTFIFGSNKPAATFECRLDAAPFSRCDSPLQLTGMSDGAHHFEVRAVEADSADPAPAVHDWTVDPNFTFTSTFVATADAMVQSKSPGSNFGLSGELGAGTSPPEQSYVKFDVDGVEGTVAKATLRVFVTDGTGNAPKVHTTTTSWAEREITYDSRPAAATSATADAGAVGSDEWLEYDVTNAVAGDATVSFALLPEYGDGMVTESREATQRPHLVVAYRHSPSTQ